MKRTFPLTDESLPHQIQLRVHRTNVLKITCNCKGFETDAQWGLPVAEYVRIYNEGNHHGSDFGTEDGNVRHLR